MKKMMSKVMLGALLLGVGLAGAATKNNVGPFTDADIANKVAHEIRMYSRYSILDNINLFE